MIKAFIGLQKLRRKIYLKAKAELAWRFWGLFVHVCKYETLYEAYKVAKRNGGAPGVDGVTFADIELAGAEAFLIGLRNELVTGTYRPVPPKNLIRANNTVFCSAIHLDILDFSVRSSGALLDESAN